MKNEVTNNDDSSVTESGTDAQIDSKLSPKHCSQPFRFGSLPPLHLAGSNLTLSGYIALSNFVQISNELENVKQCAPSGSLAETIVRGCRTIFFIVDGGGMLFGSPDIEAAKLRIDTLNAKLGFLSTNFSINTAANLVDNLNSTKEKDELSQEKEKEILCNVQVPLYAAGRLYLNALINYRVKKQKAVDNDLLLPAIPELDEKEFAELKIQLPWLSAINGISRLHWKNILQQWLIHQIRDCFQDQIKITWKEMAKLSAWRLEEMDRFSFVTSFRRNLFQTSMLPKQKLSDILNADTFTFNSVRKKHSDDRNDRKFSDDSISVNSQSESPADLIGEEVLIRDSMNLGENEPEAIEQSKIAKLLKEIAKPQLSSSQSRKLLREKTQELKKESFFSHDLEQLLLWADSKFNQSQPVSVSEQASRVQRALFAVSNKSFREFDTDDIAEYLENYSTIASHQNVLSSIKQFDNFLISKELAEAGHINWSSKLLKLQNRIPVRDIISEAEFRQVRQALFDSPKLSDTEKRQYYCILLLLRRCGLRVGEASALTIADFTKTRSIQLNISKTKTRAGKRSLPLYLLLDEEELEFIKEHLRLRSFYGDKEYIFINKRKDPFSPAAIGRIVEKLLSDGGIVNESAHGLRHAFANTMLATLYLKITAAAPDLNIYPNRFRAAISKFVRPGIEERAVYNENDIRLLMGHSDLKVTFESYFHLLEIICADIVSQSENSSNNPIEYLPLIGTAKLLGTNPKSLLTQYSADIHSGKMLSLLRAAELSANRF